VVDVAGGVSLSVLELFWCNGGRELDRAKAVSLRASSRVLVGLVPLVGDVDASLKVDGNILPMKDQRFLLGVVGESVVSFGVVSVVSSLVRAPSDEWRL
jgi:hypothetical protein